jgi:hypothetical protein
VHQNGAGNSAVSVLHHPDLQRAGASCGRQIVTLEDAGNYITKLPKAEHEAPEWKEKIEAGRVGHPFFKGIREDSQ